MSNSINRSDFVRYSALTALGLNSLPFQDLRAAASDCVRVTYIGEKGIGLNHLNWFVNLPDVEIVGWCSL